MEHQAHPLCLPLDTQEMVDVGLIQRWGDNALIKHLEAFMKYIESLKCIVCMSRFANIWLRSCGHLNMCVTCARLVYSCTTCRKRIPIDGRWLLPESLCASNFITARNLNNALKGVAQSVKDEIQVVRNESGWFLSEEQLSDIERQSLSQRVLSTTAQYVKHNLEDHGFDEQLQIEHLVDFITDVMVHGVKMHDIIQTPPFQNLIKDPGEYDQTRHHGADDLVTEMIRRRVRLRLSNGGYFTNVTEIIPAHKVFIHKPTTARADALPHASVHRMVATN